MHLTCLLSFVFVIILSNIRNFMYVSPSRSHREKCNRDILNHQTAYWIPPPDDEIFSHVFHDYLVFSGFEFHESYDVYCNFIHPKSHLTFTWRCNVNKCTLKIPYTIQKFIDNIPRVAAMANNCYDLSGNRISNHSRILSLEEHILEISMTDNKIFSIPADFFCNMSSLRRVVLFQNNLFSYDDLGFNSSDCHNLCQSSHTVTYLDLTYNSFEKIGDGAFCHFPELTTLMLTSNSISLITPNAFIYLKKLQVLGLANNLLTTLPVDVFKFQQSLTILDLSQNVELNSSIYTSLKPLQTLKGLDMTSTNQSNMFSLKTEHLIRLESLSALYLSLCRLKKLERDMFFNSVTSIKYLDLAENDIAIVPSMIFQPLTNLTKLNLNSNKIQSFEAGAFSESSLLEELYITKNILKIFPDLGQLGNLETLTLRRNRIRNITMKEHASLCKLPNLKTLDLSVNRIGHLSHGVFDCNRNLEELNLQENLISQITNVFNNAKIFKLNLQLNNIMNLSYGDISVHISELDVSCNLIAHFAADFTDSLKSMTLESLDLSHNNLTTVSNLSFPLVTDFHIDLSNNNLNSISFSESLNHANWITVDMQHNKFDTLCPLLFQSKRDESVTFEIEGNFLKCACEKVYFKQMFSGGSSSLCPNSLLEMLGNSSTITTASFRNESDFQCMKTARIIPCQCNTFAEYRSTCGLTCAKHCDCFLSADFSTKLMNCSRNHLNQIPDSLESELFTILAFSFNHLKVLANTSLGTYRTVKELYLDHNEITMIEAGAFANLPYLKVLHLEDNLLKQLPGTIFNLTQGLVELDLSNNSLDDLEDDIFNPMRRLRYLDLSNNLLTDFPVWTFENMTESEVDLNLNLGNNPWSCDCTYVERFRSFLKNTENVVESVNELYCISGSDREYEKQELITFNSTSCYDISTVVYSPSNASTWSSIVASLLVFALISVTLFMFRKEIQVWIYYHYGLRIFHKNVDVRSVEMMYDAFIAHSSNDEEFVVLNLLPGLEGITKPYNICVHQRNFLAGAIITESIIEAIEKSHRTIVVLSDHFVNSEWCRYEFQIAHQTALSDRCKRLIVIILDHIPENLEPKMKLYLKTNTYLKWGERFFWEKLYFALPDKSITFQQFDVETNQDVTNL